MGDFSFKKIPTYEPVEDTKEVEQQVDEVIKEPKTTMKLQKTDILDKIQLTNEIEKHPPVDGYGEISLDEKMYALDLRTYFQGLLADRPSTVNPMIVDRACRAAVVRKIAYQTERRMPEFNMMWIIILIIGLIGVFFILQMFGLF